MVLPRKKTSNGLVGVDIGSTSVKAVELKEKRGAYELENLALTNLRSDAIVDGAIVDPASVSSLLDTMLQENKIITPNVATSVSGRAVIVRRMIVTAATEEEIEQAIQQEANENVQLDLANYNLSYYVLGPVQEQDSLDWRADRYRGARQMDVLLLAVDREKLESHTSVVAQANKTPVIVDIDAFALQNAFELSYEPPPDQAIALLNIGASITNINITRGGVPLFTGDAPLGGNQYTDVLQKELDLTLDEAEKLKMGVEVPRIQPDAELPHLKSVSDSLLLEIQNAFDTFHQTVTDPIQAVYLAGGTARIRGLVEVLQAGLKTPVEVMDPFRKVRCNPEKFDADFIATLAPRMTVAVGLALRSFDPQ
jgi:type IV pilus assembly protein PilM